MTVYRGKDQKISLDDATGALIDITSLVSSCDYPLVIPMTDTTTFGSTGGRVTPGLADSVTITIKGFADPTQDAKWSAIYANGGGATSATPQTLSFVHGPRGSTVGLEKRTAEVFLALYTPGPNDPKTGAIAFEVQLRTDNGFVFGTY
jgi:hypothetical protein